MLALAPCEHTCVLFVRPNAKQLAIALHKRVALKRSEALTDFIYA